jgi:class 3 adenylate cyclase
MSSPRRERKVVTVLFADLVGFTARAEELDPEDVEAILRPYHERLRSELERFGGTVEKFIGDAVMALFGAPVAHEDDPERAVRAALAIRDWIAAEGRLEARIAVNTGEALINLDARPETGEGMAAGDVVNTTARMESAAPVNGVLVGETTYRATRTAIEYEDAEPVVAKGKAEPLRVWRALEPRARVETEAVVGRTPLIGREHEVDQLVGALTRVRRERSPQLVTIVGVPGIGKSRIVAELFAIVDADPELIHWRHGRSLPYGEGVTFWAIAEMVKAQAGILHNDGADDAAAKLRATVAELVPESERESLERDLRPLVGLARDDELAGDRRAESFASWRRFFESLAERRPLVLAFEDLHWADDDLLDFVDELVEWVDGVPLLVLCTARPELLDRRPGWGGGKRNAVTVSLSPLDDRDTARLVAQLLDGSALPAETQSLLLARAGGNPLYAEQFVRMFAERGSESELPETVQGIISARLDSLDAAEKSLLHNAAVIGKAFWGTALAAVGGTSGHELERSLHTLVRREFVRRSRRSSVAGEAEWEFGHALVRDVAYGQIPRAERAAKHRSAAEWIEALAPDRSDDRAEMLAHHYLAALEYSQAAGLDLGDIAGAARVALRDAADRAAALGSYRQALRYYDAALELWPDDDPERPEIALRRAHAEYEFGGRIDLDEVTPIVEAVTSTSAPELAAEGEILLAKVAWQARQTELVEAHGDRALGLLRDSHASAAKALVLIERARLTMLAYDWGRSRALLAEGLAMAEQLGLERLLASGLITLGTIPGEDAIGLLSRGIEIALRLNDVQQIQRGYNNLALEHWRRGDLHRAAETYAKARPLVQRFGGRELARGIDAAEGSMLYFTGDWNGAQELFDAFFGQETGGAPHYLDPVALVFRGLIAYARGDVERGLRDIERSAALTRETLDTQARIALQHCASPLIDEGRRDEASRLLDISLTAGYLLHIFALDGALAMAELGRATEIPARITGAEMGATWLEILDALAEEDFAAAADLYARLGAKPYEARARLRAAERLARTGNRTAAAEQAGRALGFYESVGAIRFAREAEALLPATA